MPVRARMTRERATLAVLRSIPLALAMELVFVGMALFALVAVSMSH